MQVTKTNKVQISYFFRTSEFKSFEFTNKLYEELQEVFKCDPQIVPVPLDAPAELPRCVWNSPNVTLTYNLIKLDIVINIPTGFQWDQLIAEFSRKVYRAITESNVHINRVGIVTENLVAESIHDELNKKVEIEQFQSAKELNISWRENIEEDIEFNVWTNISINEDVKDNIVIFDINSVTKEDDIDIIKSLTNACLIMERKMSHVF